MKSLSKAIILLFCSIVACSALAEQVQTETQIQAPIQAQIQVQIDDPWIKEAPPVARSLAGYMTLRNEGTETLSLVDVYAEGFGMAMFHESKMENGMAVMNHLDSLALAPGEAVSFEPGGLHIMLMKPEKALKAGDKVLVTLCFGDQGYKGVEFEVKKIFLSQ